MKLDAIDLRILAAVRQDGRITKLKLAEIAGLSPTPCWLRLRKLEQAGIIAGYHTRMRAMSFTGSTGVGRLIATQCAPTMKRLVLEPGGHAPLIVFADADIDCGVQITLDAKFATSGQDCLAANRIHVERAILPAFTEKRAARIAVLKVGPGLDSTTEVAP